MLVKLHLTDFNHSVTNTFLSLTAEALKKPKALPDRLVGGLVGLGV